MITIVLADDHAIVRQGLRALLSAQPGLQVIGEAGDGREAVELVQQLRPRVLLLDLMMPALSGLEVTRQVARLTRVVILSMHANEAYVVEALRSGAAGYVLKDSTADELVCAVRAAAAGERYLSSPFSEQSVEAYIERAELAQEERLLQTLTPREREVLQLTVEGLSAAEAAARLCISPRTVEAHRSNLMHKLGVKSQAELIRLALQAGPELGL